MRRWTCALILSAIVGIGTFTASEEPAVTSIHAITASPDQYSGRPVRVTGRFQGRVAEDASRPVLKPLRSRWDFLLKWNDDAVWVSGLRPLGRDFDLDPLSVSDTRTGRWLEVTGTLRVDRRRRAPCGSDAGCSNVWIDATDVRLAAPPWGTFPQSALRPTIAPPTVVFHDPITDEVNVPRSIAVRLQFSKHMAADTLSGRVRVSYASPRPLFSTPIPGFRAAYHDETRGLDIRFTAPLAAFETVLVELLGGIRAQDGQELQPWTLTFTTGESRE